MSLLFEHIKNLHDYKLRKDVKEVLGDMLVYNKGLAVEVEVESDAPYRKKETVVIRLENGITVTIEREGLAGE